MSMDNLREIIKKAEIKRVGERLTKKELCNIYINSTTTSI